MYNKYTFYWRKKGKKRKKEIKRKKKRNKWQITIISFIHIILLTINQNYNQKDSLVPKIKKISFQPLKTSKIRV